MPAGLPVAVVGTFLMAFGLALVVTPRRASTVIARSDRGTLQALGGVVRVAAGLGLVYGADATAYPEGVFLFGAVMVAAGVMILVVDEARFSSWIDAWLRGSMVWRLRAGGGLALVAGGLLCASVMI
jgi:hypothetical protein